MLIKQTMNNGKRVDKFTLFLNLRLHFTSRWLLGLISFNRGIIRTSVAETADSNIMPVVSEPVRSRMKPSKKGPLNPPISAAEKNRPAAAPIRLAPILGVSISMRVCIGIIGPRTIFEIITDRISIVPVVKMRPTPATAAITRSTAIVRAR